MAQAREIIVDVITSHGATATNILRWRGTVCGTFEFASAVEAPVRFGINILRYAKVLVSMAAMEMTFPIITSRFVWGEACIIPGKNVTKK